jgi:hypothetical protein
MAKATIKSQSGAVITVEGSESEVSNIISVFERTSVVSHSKETSSKRKVQKKETKKLLAASDLLVNLKEDGFFEKPKSLSDISKALEDRGYLYPVTSLSGIALSFVQKKILRRKKVEGKWVYGK